MAIMSDGEKHRENRGPKNDKMSQGGKTALVQVHLHFPLCFRRCVLRLSCEGSFDRNTKTEIRNKICVFFGENVAILRPATFSQKHGFFPLDSGFRF